MPKLDDIAIDVLRNKVRSLSREAAIEVLLGIINVMQKKPSLRAVEFPSFVDDGVLLTVVKNHE